MSTIVVVEDVWGQAIERLARRHRVLRRPEAWAEPSTLGCVLQGAHALVVRNRTQVTRHLLQASSSLEIVARAGAGLDNIDLQAADELGVVVVAAVGANAVSVAEHAVCLALGLSRHLIALDGSTRSGGWDRRTGRELAGGTWGLLGAGSTGRATGRLAGALGMRVLAHDPFLAMDDLALRELEIELVGLDELFTRSDVISCHLPATPATRGLVGQKLLARMGADALFINVGRGEVVDEDALADALEDGQISGAGLDVRATEPPQPGRLEKLPNVILTPHVAGITSDSQARIDTLLADQIERVLGGCQASYAVGRHRSARTTP